MASARTSRATTAIAAPAATPAPAAPTATTARVRFARTVRPPATASVWTSRQTTATAVVVAFPAAIPGCSASTGSAPDGDRDRGPCRPGLCVRRGGGREAAGHRGVAGGHGAVRTASGSRSDRRRSPAGARGLSCRGAACRPQLTPGRGGRCNPARAVHRRDRAAAGPRGEGGLPLLWRAAFRRGRRLHAGAQRRLGRARRGGGGQPATGRAQRLGGPSARDRGAGRSGGRGARRRAGGGRAVRVQHAPAPRRAAAQTRRA